MEPEVQNISSNADTNNFSSLDSQKTVINISSNTEVVANGDQNGNSERGLTSLTSTSGVDTNCSDSEVGVRVPIIGYEVIEERSRFTVYKLKVEDQGLNRSWLVFRRYTDFVRLDNKLRSAYPQIRLPLPGKRLFKDNFETSFLEERSRCLQQYVNELVKNFPRNPLVREFLCLDEPPILRHRSSITLEQSLEVLTRRLRDLYTVVHSCESCSSKIQNFK